MTREQTVRNLLTELIDMIDNGSQKDLDRTDEIGTSIIKLLEQEPCEDAVSRKALISHIENQSRKWGEDYDAQQILGDIEDMPSVKPQTGYCEDCKHFRKLPYHADALGKCAHHGGFCPKGDWYCADFEPQESEDKG